MQALLRNKRLGQQVHAFGWDRIVAEYILEFEGQYAIISDTQGDHALEDQVHNTFCRAESISRLRTTHYGTTTPSGRTLESDTNAFVT